MDLRSARQCFVSDRHSAVWYSFFGGALCSVPQRCLVWYSAVHVPGIAGQSLCSSFIPGDNQSLGIIVESGWSPEELASKMFVLG